MLRIKEDKAVLVLTLDELWWLYDHLPREDGVTREIYEAIKRLEEAKLQKKLGPALWVEIIDTNKEEHNGQ